MVRVQKILNRGQGLDNAARLENYAWNAAGPLAPRLSALRLRRSVPMEDRCSGPHVHRLPGVCRAAGIRRGHRRDAVHPQQLLVPHLGRAGDVDVRRLHHAGGRFCPHQERLGHLPEEHRPLFHRRPHLLSGRLQPDVCGCRQLGRVVPAPLLDDGRRDRPAGGRRSRGRGRRHRRRRSHRRGGQRLRHDVRLVLPDGVRGDDRLDRLRHPGRAREALVVLHLHHAC